MRSALGKNRFSLLVELWRGGGDKEGWLSRKGRILHLDRVTWGDLAQVGPVSKALEARGGLGKDRYKSLRQKHADLLEGWVGGEKARDQRWQETLS